MKESAVLTSPIAPQNAPPLPTQLSPADKQLMDVARELEVSFLAEMLKSVGAGAPRDTFGGGAGEEQFSSFLRMAQAREMVEGGGLGLAESLFEALKERSDALV